MYGQRGRYELLPLVFERWIKRSTPGYATASVEGRIAVEYFDPSQESQDKKYAFKCHRQTIDGVDHVWPVNALAFHPMYDIVQSFLSIARGLTSIFFLSYNTFASAGSDGTVSVWDHKIKKRLRQYPKFNNPVSSVAFNCDGTKIAIASCYTWDEGEQGARMERERPQVWIKTVGPEVKVSFHVLLFHMVRLTIYFI